MKFKLVWLQVVLSSTLIFCASISTAQPLDAEDVESLLPMIPRNTNDTLAAVVQDPVVQDAVHYAASNGSLNGLVVKKRVFIMPASEPKKVLSEREQVLIVPTEHLEDVRRNITEAKQPESGNDVYTDAYTTERAAAPSSLNFETHSTSVQNREAPNIFDEGLHLTPVIIPALDIAAPLLQTTKSGVYPRDVDDMDVAEDIIFRPLFRYRQKEQQRLKYREENENRRRYNYRRYNPRRDYRYKSRYDYDY